ncbi:hypothetical protein DYB26_007382 [Aphanomyces astaci]|uniref:Tetratricopeptide repeat protein 21B n=1 Tax=Aphanomyces astaci TaxID=112090 RepID=A0A418CMR8_APHAT|nr:hypothetical protein DYB26_007382 [Aphanomyces astaci]
MIKADIYLQHRNEKKLYAECYKELVRLNPTADALVRLAEAYLRIQQLNDAIESYRSALVLSPHDASLASRIGHILVKKHDYISAIEYYETALRAAPDQTPLRRDLASLLTKLSHFDQALRVVNAAPAAPARTEIKDMLDDIELQLILPDIYNGLDRKDECVTRLLKVIALQKVVLDKLRDEQPDEIHRQTHHLANTNFKLAQIYAEQNDAYDNSHVVMENVMKYCTMALRANESHEEAILCLARIYNQQQNLEQCQIKCSTLLRLNPAHEEAAMMLADIMLQKDDNESAIFHFQNLLESKPDNFTVLSRFIVMLRQAGKLDRAPRFLKLADRSGPRVAHSAGLHYCKGLYNRFQNNIHDAIQEFNFARKDGEWGQRALVHMIEIYINPDSENLWDNPDDSNKDQMENMRIANALLDELSPDKSVRIRVLECYAAMSAKTKPMVEKATATLLELLEEDRDNVPALLGTCQSKARNQLKRIAKMNYDAAIPDEFERSYILLADIYVNRAKYDLAQELCKKALQHNKSSGKAWELLGLIMEKEQSYQDAADCYHEAWKCGGEASAPIGFKLAFNYLKAKRFVEAIDVSQKVLDKFPDYPKIRKEIREKAQAGLRP